LTPVPLTAIVCGDPVAPVAVTTTLPEYDVSAVGVNCTATVQFDPVPLPGTSTVPVTQVLEGPNVNCEGEIATLVSVTLAFEPVFWQVVENCAEVTLITWFQKPVSVPQEIAGLAAPGAPLIICCARAAGASESNNAKIGKSFLTRVAPP
jgi:hypothetical protein